jgi:hypothetical protein
VPIGDPIDIDRPDEAVLADVDRQWQRIGYVPVGGTLEPSMAPR